MKNLVLIQHEPLTEHLEKIFCIQDLINAGFSIEYWDISQICNPGIKLPNLINRDYVRVIRDVDEFKKKINILNPDEYICIVEILFSFENRALWKIIDKSGLKIIKFERYGNTVIPSTDSLFLTFFKKIKQGNLITKIVRKLLFVLCIRLYKLRQYDYLVTSANLENVCRVNHPDYDLYLQDKRAKPLLDYNYIVFIDTGFGKHPDELFFKGSIKKNDNLLWQSKLCKFFEFIEKLYKIPVVIAVHPKLDYKDEEFGGRLKIKNATLNLISNADYVMQDQSNSVSFSILENKRIGFVATAEYLKEHGQYMTDLTSLLGLSIFNIDNDNFTNFKFSQIQDEKRKAYIYNYLTSQETEDKSTSEIFVNFCKSL